jgi:hypothetical protein
VAYTAKNGIPGWDHSADAEPQAARSTGFSSTQPAAVVGDPDENQHIKTVNRYRDVAMRPDVWRCSSPPTSGATQDQSEAGAKSRTPARSSNSVSPIDRDDNYFPA